MFKRTTTILAVILMTAILAQPAVADYWGGVNSPDWSANPYYTNQTWTFTNTVSWIDQDLDNDGDADAGLVMPPVAADAGYTNPYTANQPGMPPMTYPGFYNTTFGDSFAWDWIDQGPMGQNWEGLQGMIGGMGSGSVDFYIPNAEVSGTKDIWVQYVAYIPNGSDGSAVDAQLASDVDFANLVGTRTGKSWEQITELDDQGGTGDWWRVTEEWQIVGAVDVEFLRILTADHGTANMIDSVDVMTQVNAVPIPGAVWLLGTGLLGLMGMSRRKK